MRFYEDYRVGETFRTQARSISPEEVDTFVEYIGVRNPLFLDAKHAAQSPFHTRIIPGFLTQSLALGLMYADIIQDFLLLEARSRFLKPVHIGDSIHVEGRVTSKKSRPAAKAGQLTLKTKILNQNNTRAAELNLTISLLKRPPNTINKLQRTTQASTPQSHPNTKTQNQQPTNLKETTTPPPTRRKHDHRHQPLPRQLERRRIQRPTQSLRPRLQTELEPPTN